MEKIATPSKTKEILQKYDFKIKKSFGQNFLIDEHVIQKIVACSEISENDIVLEIGPGFGGLTQELAEHAKKVIAVELDKLLIPILTENMAAYSNVSIVNQDILKFDFSEKFDKVVANLPYYITTPVVMMLLEKKLKISSITVMVQKEVAERMQAKPGTKDYGALTLAVEYYSDTKIITNVAESCFIPRPSVESTVIKLDVLQEPKVKVMDEKFLFQIIKASFAQRRKTLLNALSNGNICEKSLLRDCLQKMGKDENVRGETFSIFEFGELTNLIYSFNHSS